MHVQRIRVRPVAASTQSADTDVNVLQGSEVRGSSAPPSGLHAGPRLPCVSVCACARFNVLRRCE